MLISIIIVNYNTGEVLKNCINSIYKFEKPDDFEIIIVDQNSSDNSKKIIEELTTTHQNIKMILQDKNTSFSYANNQGYDISSADNILIMNPDIIFKGSVLNKLVDKLKKHPEIGAVCPLLVGKDGKFQKNYFQRFPTLMLYILFYSIISKPFYKIPWLMNRYLENQDIDSDSKKIELVEQIPCAFFLTRRSVYEQVGKMDENYELFFEDVDLSYQINKKYKLAIDTSVKVMHLGGVSFNVDNNWWQYARVIISLNYFFDKNYSWLRAFLLKVFTVKNSLLVVSFEYTKKIFGKSNEYRLNRHKYFLKEFKKYYL